jgi:hypothetical protein
MRLFSGHQLKALGDAQIARPLLGAAEPIYSLRVKSVLREKFKLAILDLSI